MTNRRFRFPVKVLAALLSLACFLAFEIVAVSPVLAAEPAPKPPTTWETWPRTAPGTTTGPAAAGEAAGAQTSSGISAGTWGWIAGGVAAVALIAVAAGGGGGGSSSPPACNQ